jgi:anti-sigma factor RsiW
VSCEAPHLQLDAFVDGELDASAQVEVETHLAVCPECRDEAAFTRALKHELRTQMAPPEAPAALRDRVRDALREADAPGQPRWQERAWAGAFVAAAAAVLVVLGTLVSSPPPASPPALAEGHAPAAVQPAQSAQSVAQSTQPAQGMQPTQVVAGRNSRATAQRVAEHGLMSVLGDVVAGHVDALPSEVGTEEPERLTGWFRDKLGFRVASVQFSEPDVRFEGARVFHVANQRAARLHYRVGDSRVTLMAFEATPSLRRALAAGAGGRRVRVGDRELAYHQVRGYTVPVFERDGIVYAFTGDLDTQRLLKLVASARMP